MRSAALAAVMVLLAGCDYDPRGRCASAGECPTGQVCAGGVCATPAPAPPNHPPLATAKAYAVVAGRWLECPADAGLLVDASDPDGDPLEAERAAAASRGSVFVEPSGAFRYLPDADFTEGTDTFTYRASDGVLRSAATTVTLTIAAP